MEKTKVREGHELNNQNLFNYIKKSLSLNPNTSISDFQISQYSSGQSNPTYYIKISDLELVLRKKPFGKLLKGNFDNFFMIIMIIIIIFFFLI